MNVELHLFKTRSGYYRVRVCWTDKKGQQASYKTEPAVGPQRALSMAADVIVRHSAI